MASFNRLKHAPLQSGFSVDLGSDVIMQQLDGGAPRFRRMARGTPHQVAVSWKLKKGDYQYLMAFYRVWQRTPSRPFYVEMAIDDPAIKEYLSWFSPGSIKLASKNGELFTINAQLIVMKLDTSDEADDLLVAVGNENQNMGDLKNGIEEIPNEDFPKATGVDK